MGFVAEAEHSDGIVSFVVTDAAPLPWEAFARCMETLIALRGPDLLRVKGFLNVAGCRGPVVVHVVQHLAHPPVELAAWPDADHSSRLVFITRNIPERQVRDLLASVRALAGGWNSPHLSIRIHALRRAADAEPAFCDHRHSNIVPAPRRWRQSSAHQPPTKEGPMSHVTFAAPSRYRIYDLDLPHRIPGFAVGFAITKFKQIGVWSKPAGAAGQGQGRQGVWGGGLKLTQKDLDSVPDDAWETIARALSVRWRYATEPSECAREPALALG